MILKYRIVVHSSDMNTVDITKSGRWSRHLSHWRQVNFYIVDTNLSY